MRNLFALALLLPLFSQAASACPVLNGQYERSTTVGNETTTITMTFITRQAAGVTYYSSNGMPEVAADGVAHAISANGQTGTLKITCDGTGFTADAKLDTGATASMHVTVVSDTLIDLTAQGQDSDMIAGRYTRK